MVLQFCSGRYLPKPESVKNTEEKWTEVAKKIGFNDEQTTAVVNLMHFIQDRDIASAEMDTDEEWETTMVNSIYDFLCGNRKRRLIC